MVSIKFFVAGINSLALIHFPDQDCDRQVTEAGVIRGTIQKPERSSEEVSISCLSLSCSRILGWRSCIYTFLYVCVIYLYI